MSGSGRTRREAPEGASDLEALAAEGQADELLDDPAYDDAAFDEEAPDGGT